MCPRGNPDCNHLEGATCRPSHDFPTIMKCLCEVKSKYDPIHDRCENRGKLILSMNSTYATQTLIRITLYIFIEFNSMNLAVWHSITFVFFPLNFNEICSGNCDCFKLQIQITYMMSLVRKCKILFLTENLIG